MLVALEALHCARESLDDHVCDSLPQSCSLCHLACSLTAATSQAARAFDDVETGSATLVDGDAVDVVLVDVQELP